jgi:hypothetical protein
MTPDPGCERWGKVETMEHLLWECEYYSELLLNRLAEILTQLFNSIPAGQVPRVELGQINVSYNFPHLSILLYSISPTRLHTISCSF